MLQNTLVGFYKTGNIIIDMIITFVIVALCQKIMSNNINYDYLLSFIKRKTNVKSEYIIEGKIKSTTEPLSTYNSILIPIEFKAVMYKIDSLKVKIKSVKQYNRTNECLGKHYLYVINDKDDIQVTDDIWIKQSNIIDKSNDNKIEIESYYLHVFSYTLTFSELHETIVQWSKEYDEYLRELDNDKNIYYYSLFGYEGSKREPVYDRSVFGSNKTFDNIFFDEKQQLLDRLIYFMEKKDEYKRLGTPYTLGLLFYGEPGCGKTSTIKAIANLMRRHIISIPLSRVETCQEFTKVFTDDFFEDRYIPIESRIYVFEDIDCMSDIITDRDQIKQNDKDNDLNKILVCVKGDTVDNENIGFNKKDKITLSYILNMIDGVLEQPGRIIIMTTNKPDKLDKALLRPGRIDMKIHFGKSSSKITKQIFGFFFKEEIEKKSIDINSYQFPDKIYTAAEIYQICYNNNNFEQSFDRLINNQNNNNTLL